MKVLALDLSLSATGVCADGAGLNILRPKQTGTPRLAWFDREIGELIQSYTFDVAVVEDFVERSPTSARTATLHGVVRVLLYFHQIPTVLVPPASLKKYATGKGNATKPDMRVALLQRAEIDERDDNLVDAMWLRLMAMDAYGEPEFTLPQTHRVALDKVEWPELVSS